MGSSLYDKRNILQGKMRKENRVRDILDEQARALVADLQKDLGLWIRRRLQKVIKIERQCRDELEKCPFSLDELRSQWKLQRHAQTNAPTRMYYII